MWEDSEVFHERKNGISSNSMLNKEMTEIEKARFYHQFLKYFYGIFCVGVHIFYFCLFFNDEYQIISIILL